MRKWVCVFLLCFCVFPLYGHAADTGTGESSTPAAGEVPGEHGKFAKNLVPNEPIYFSAGPHGGWSARFQLSFKYRLHHGMLLTDDRLFLAYTQTSLWDLSSPSVPFYDSSYRPSIIYEVDNTDPVRPRGSLPWWQAGLEHESNGKAGSDSRSINILFVRPNFFFGHPGDSSFRIAPKVWAYLDRSDNRDIARYRGFADLLLIYDMGKAFGFFEGSQISADFRKGSRKDYGSIQLDATYPLGTTFYLHLQYFTGYGETILDYNKRSSQIRAGIMLVRW